MVERSDTWELGKYRAQYSWWPEMLKCCGIICSTMETLALDTLGQAETDHRNDTTPTSRLFP